LNLSSLPSSIPDVRFSLIRLCFVSSQCILHRDRPRGSEKLQSFLLEYFQPTSPELKIDTTEILQEEAVQEILLFLGEKGYI